MKYFAVDLVNYDENNIPYPVETVHCAANKVLSREEATEFCREDLEMDFEEVFKVEEVTLDEVLEYVDEVNEIPKYDNSLDAQITAAEKQGESQRSDEKVSERKIERE